jgi:hypothetical protein
MLRSSEYIALIIHWMDVCLSQKSRDRAEPWHVSNELGFSQALVGIGQLATHQTSWELLVLSGLEEKSNKLLEDLAIDLNQSHTEILPGILWAY